MPFSLNYSPFARISDLSRTVWKLLPCGYLEIKEFEFAQGKTEPDVDTTLYQMGISESAYIYVRGRQSLMHENGSIGKSFNILYGAGVEDSWDMGLVAGGRIKQTILKNSNPRAWNKTALKKINIQMINSVAFKAITGLVPPMPTISFEDFHKD